MPTTAPHTSRSIRARFRHAAATAMVVLLVAGGCDEAALTSHYVNPSRSAEGVVIILPGIEGEGAANHNIRKGLDQADVPYSLAIYRWGFPVPGIGLIVNQTNTAGNRGAGKKLAGRIVEYQQKHPGRPVFLIGHSAGGGVAVFTLEALGKMPKARPVTGVFLLSASISANYPLAGALRMTKQGLVNVYNPDDTALLGTGTAIFGNVDGGRGDSAGRTGFHGSHPKLYQRKITSASVGVAGDPHFLATNAHLISRLAPPWLLSDRWPPPSKR